MNQRYIGMILISVVLIGLVLFFGLKPQNQSPPGLDNTDVEIVKVAAKVPEMRFGIATKDYEAIEGRIRRNQTIADILFPYNISRKQIFELDEASKDVFSVRKLVVSKKYTLLYSVDSVPKMIERIMLLTIEKFIIEKIFKQDTKKLQNEKNITKEKQKQVVLQAMLLALGGGGGGGGFKPFAKGGAVSKGQPIVVGEQGAELFVPNQTGQITQSARGTGGGSTTVNFNINTVDASGFEELLVRSRGTITQLINNAVNERGSKNLI